jgi:hypothetical protein
MLECCMLELLAVSSLAQEVRGIVADTLRATPL